MCLVFVCRAYWTHQFPGDYFLMNGKCDRIDHFGFGAFIAMTIQIVVGGMVGIH